MSRQRARMLTATRILLGLLLFGVTAATAEGKARDGTPKHLREIFIGRCAEFSLHNERRGIRCEDHWQQFSGSFVGKDPNHMTESDYGEFVSALAEPLNDDQTILYTRTRQLVQKLTQTNKQYRSILDTLVGYLADDLTWCGSADSHSDGIDYHSCQGDANFLAFWRAASAKFAKQAKGEVYIVLNGSNETPYRQTSILASHEIPNLNRRRVKLVKALVVHDWHGGHRGEECNQGTLDQLRRDVLAVGLKYECVDDPPVLQALDCIRNLRIDAEELCSPPPAPMPMPPVKTEL